MAHKMPDGIRKKKTTIDLSYKRKGAEPASASIHGMFEKDEETPKSNAHLVREHKEGFMEKMAHEHKGEEGILITEEINDLKESAKRHYLKKFRVSLVRFGIISAGLAIVGVFALLSTVFARITVTLKPKVETVAIQDVLAVFDSSVSKVLLPQKVLPAERLEFSRNLLEEFESTGRKFIEEKARGKVRLYNSFSSSQQTLVQNTRFVNDAGQIFRLGKNVVVPGAEIAEGKIVPKFIEVELTADAVGEQANISEGQKLRIPGFKGGAKYDAFYALTANAFMGGFKGEARVVSADDIKKAQEQVTKKLYESLQNEIARKIPPNFKLVDAFREIQIIKVDIPKENTRRDHFPVEAKASGRVIVFRESDVVELVKAVALKNNSTKELVPDSLSLQYRVRNVDFEKGKADTILRGEVRVSSVIPQDELVGFIRGKKEGSLIDALKERQDLASFSVAFFPPWIFSAPDNPAKIKFDIQKP